MVLKTLDWIQPMNHILVPPQIPREVAFSSPGTLPKELSRHHISYGVFAEAVSRQDGSQDFFLLDGPQV